MKEKTVLKSVIQILPGFFLKPIFFLSIIIFLTFEKKIILS